MEENFIGSKFINSIGCIYIVTRFISKDTKASYWEVVFPYTGYSGIFTKNQIIRGYIKDRLSPLENNNLKQKLVYQSITNRQKTTQNGWKFSK